METMLQPSISRKRRVLKDEDCYCPSMDISTFESWLRCPKCKGLLQNNEMYMSCENCAIDYPNIDGRPVLINEGLSYFKVSEIISSNPDVNTQNSKFESISIFTRSALIFKGAIYKIFNFSPTIYSKKRMKNIGRILTNQVSTMQQTMQNDVVYKVLILGGGTSGNIFSSVDFGAHSVVVATDVYLSKEIDVICDGAFLPFENETFDAIFAEGVFEHVINPELMAAEASRVLKKSGLIFVSTPFLLGVHMEVADYQRWTKLGLIRLLRGFKPIECQPIEGPLVALAYQISYVAMSVTSKRLRGLTKLGINFFVGWFKLLDPLIRSKPISEDACASFYYIGIKSEQILSDEEVNNFFTGFGICPK